MFKGIFTALLTPFDQNGRINDKALERLVKHNIKMGVKGFYVCGSTGEAFLLSRDERKHVMETVRAVAPDSTLIAHVGSINEEEAIDLVVSDVVMSGTTGYELCRQIKENIQISHIPVILLTAKANVGDQVQGLDSGADAYVTKPFEPQYLLALIQSQLKNREKIRDILSKATDVETLEEDALSPQDSAFMTELYQLMENELANSELDVSRMTEMLHISRTKFYYKVKGLTGENPSVFFKRYKLNRAAQLILERKYNVSEIADMTGFSTLSHFSTSFKKQFGVSPSEYSI